MRQQPDHPGGGETGVSVLSSRVVWVRQQAAPFPAASRFVSVLSSRVVWVRQRRQRRSVRDRQVSVLSSRVVWVRLTWRTRPCEITSCFSSLKSSRLGETMTNLVTSYSATGVSVLSSRVVWVRLHGFEQFLHHDFVSVLSSRVVWVRRRKRASARQSL